MELRRLKTRLKTAARGHKLLKDKSDEMVRQFMVYIQENKRLREVLDVSLSGALGAFMFARAVSSPQNTLQAVSMPAKTVEIEAGEKNVMGIDVPFITVRDTGEGELYPYSFASTTAELDASIATLSEVMEQLIRLAEVEKTCNMLAVEIEKNRRRVNALEFVMIPQLQETIKYILMKLDENERATTIRLMKVKSMIKDK